MSSPGRKIARQNKRNTPEGREQIKQEQADKQASATQLNSMPQKQTFNQGHVPLTQVRQRRSGNA